VKSVNSQTSDQIEELLCTAYERQAEWYEQALETSECLPASFEQGQNPDEVLRRLRSILDEIESSQQQMHSVRRRWESLRRRPGPRLRRAIEKLEPMLKKLITIISSAEELACEARDRLMPKISQERRGQQMRQAYASVVARFCEQAGE
jgi:hypothetical protein